MWTNKDVRAAAGKPAAAFRIILTFLLGYGMLKQTYENRKEQSTSMKKEPFVTLEQLKEIDKTYPTPYHLYDEKGIR